MPTLVNLVVYAFLIWVAVVSARPLTVGNFLILETGSAPQLTEITSNGTEIQQFDLSLCPISAGNIVKPQISIAEDNTVSFVCMTGPYLTVYIIDKTGTLKAKNILPNMYLKVYGSVIVGNDVWISAQTFIPNLINTWVKASFDNDGVWQLTNISTNPVNAAPGPRLFYSYGAFTFIQGNAVNVVTEPNNPFPVMTELCPSSVLGNLLVSAWFPYSDMEFYYTTWDDINTSGLLLKATKGNDGIWTTYSISMGPATFIFGVTASDFEGVRKVFISYAAEVWSCTDNLSSFDSPAKAFATKDNTFNFLDIAYIHPPAACDDNKKNQNESDVDCGGVCGSNCDDAKKCRTDSDCTNGFCNSNLVCATPTCSDSAKNQNETDVDCGGVCGATCEDSKVCAVNSDCKNDYCTAGFVCATPTCNDGALNQNETDVDCGGVCGATCKISKNCNVASDCESGNCNVDQICTATCSDSVMNQDETDVDCGGSNCPGCADDLKCLKDYDCFNQYCNASLLCVTPTCTDSVKNLNETDVDCGGYCGATCKEGSACLVDTDCITNKCTENVCAPTCSDGILNQGETDIDCGGNHCISCAVGKKCKLNSDCQTQLCDNLVCAEPPVPVAVPTSVPVSESPQSSNSPTESSPDTPTQSPRGLVKVSSATTQVIPIVILTVLAVLAL